MNAVFGKNQSSDQSSIADAATGLRQNLNRSSVS